MEKICLDTVIQTNPFDNIDMYKPTDEELEHSHAQMQWNMKAHYIAETLKAEKSILYSVFKVRCFSFLLMGSRIPEISEISAEISENGIHFRKVNFVSAKSKFCWK